MSILDTGVMRSVTILSERKSSMRIFITGATGMVGRNLLEHPELESYEVLTPGSSELNLLDYEAVERYLLKNKPDLIIHAAGKVGGIQANIKEPVSFLLDNLNMGQNIIRAARKIGVKRLINLASSCMYPRGAQNPLNEDILLQGELEPTNEGYALAKIATTKLCEYIHYEDNSFQYKTLIPCNLYGKWDKFDPLHSHMIPAVISKIHMAKITNQREVEIWGDGTARREFMYVGDLADCLIRAVKMYDSLPMKMNVGLGYDLTISEYYKQISEVIGYEGTFVYDLTKPAGMKQKVVDINRQLAWGWRASRTLREGLLETYQHYKQKELN